MQLAFLFVLLVLCSELLRLSSQALSMSCSFVQPRSQAHGPEAVLPGLRRIFGRCLNDWGR